MAAGKADRISSLPADRLAELYDSYENLRRERNLVDFESVLELTAAILAEHQAAAARSGTGIATVVDEYGT
jgi:DNA helicase-2/ATP-dependent DNA helicase PcrA